MKTVTVTIEFRTEVPDAVDLDTDTGWAEASELAARDLSTRSESEIEDTVVEIEYGGE